MEDKAHNSLKETSQELCAEPKEYQSDMLSNKPQDDSRYESSDGVSDNSQETAVDVFSKKCNNNSSHSGDEYFESAACKLVEEAEALNHVNEVIKETDTLPAVVKLVEKDEILNCVIEVIKERNGNKPAETQSTSISDLADNVNKSLGDEEPSVNMDSNLSEDVNGSNTEYFPQGYKIIRISEASKEFKCKEQMMDVFLKGCKWSPDGTCLLTCCEDKWLRIFDLPTDLYTEKEWANNKTLPDLKNAVKVKASGRVYDFCWYPLMNSWAPDSCCFFTSSAGEPVHLWDAYDGLLRASYHAVNYADELITPLSITCCPEGENLYCGFKSKLHVYDIAYSGSKPTIYDTKVLTGQSGLISTIAVNPICSSLFAVGTYEKTVGLYSAEDGSGICVFSGHSGGLTHMIFSPDGSRLYTGSRSDQEIVCWDLRTPGKVLFSLSRNVTTHQRVYFDLTPDEKTLITGNTDGCVSLWSLSDDRSLSDQEPLLPDFSFTAHNDCTNGVSINKHYPVLATSSGQRHVPDLVHDNDDSNDAIDKSSFFDYNSMEKKKENCVKLWWIGHVNGKC